MENKKFRVNTTRIIKRPDFGDDDDYVLEDWDVRNPSTHEIEPRDGPNGICAQEIDAVSVNTIGYIDKKGKPIFDSYVSDNPKDIDEEVRRWKEEQKLK